MLRPDEIVLMVEAGRLRADVFGSFDQLLPIVIVAPDGCQHSSGMPWR